MSELHATETAEVVPDGTPKYPHINVPMVGEDGNAFSILGRAARCARDGGLSTEQIAEFRKEATSGDYNHLLCTVMEFFNVDQNEEEDDFEDDLDELIEDDDDDEDDFLEEDDDEELLETEDEDLDDDL